ncbi:MAG TPA: hypothetical protein VGV08_12365 [Casimicrobiaceae bacterium]|nr:hypothetical protein [Casimicrobiaceae bacterium]
MCEPVRVLPSGQRIDVAGLSLHTALPECLREVRRLTGSKRGCVEGDCGVGTVALMEPAGDRLEWKPVNACLRLLPSVDAKVVLSFERLAEGDGVAHPLERALALDGAEAGPGLPAKIRDVSRRYGLTLDPARLVHAMSIGERQRVEIVRCLLPYFAKAGWPANAFRARTIRSGRHCGRSR